METTETNKITNDNLWPAQQVVERNGILVVLKNTYKYSTYECAENFFERRWYDNSFHFLIDGVICQTDESREHAMANLIITNYFRRIFKDSEEKPNDDDWDESFPDFRDRLRILQPRVVFLAWADTDNNGRASREVRRAIQEFPGMRFIQSVHPSFHTESNWQRLKDDWALI